MAREIAIIDYEISGHHSQHLNELIRYLAHNAIPGSFNFVLHPGYTKHYPEVIDLMERARSKIKVTEIERNEYQQISGTKSIYGRSRAEWRIAQMYAAQLCAKHSILMDLNAYQFALGIPSRRNNTRTVSGILFAPYPRITWGAGPYGRIRVQHAKILKWLRLCWALSNKSVTRVHVLNDAWAAASLNRHFPFKKIFRELPDPVLFPTDTAADAPSLSERYHIDKSRKILLLFGSLSARKGVIEALDACEQLEPRTASGVTLLLLGKPVSGFETILQARLAGFRQRQTRLQVVDDLRYVDISEMTAAFKECDCVLAPYQRTESSSGVIGQAAGAERPVIGAAGGLVGALIREYNLGYAIDPANRFDFAQAISAIADRPGRFDPSGMRRYCGERSYEAFCRKLLEGAGCC